MTEAVAVTEAVPFDPCGCEDDPASDPANPRCGTPYPPGTIPQPPWRQPPSEIWRQRWSSVWSLLPRDCGGCEPDSCTYTKSYKATFLPVERHEALEFLTTYTPPCGPRDDRECEVPEDSYWVKYWEVQYEECLASDAPEDDPTAGCACVGLRQVYRHQWKPLLRRSDLPPAPHEEPAPCRPRNRSKFWRPLGQETLF